ncbi:uncharacterized protein LOC112567847 isoform X2 [Pomacea canaliculata]|uniref:uncharacterized protein LOC112567847 isoform X2 n=1 Tax=Pomacea canaliculata TaxID=400727 RepID=UPI000D7332F4|nr:uncharacterized protein LOC112567847 isoform X2 [Pomacea canaliculata]
MAVWQLWILCGSSLLASGLCLALSIRGCEHGSADAVEDSNPVFTCSEYTTNGPNWTVYNDEGQQLYSGSCSMGSCTPSNNQFLLDQVKLKKNKMYTSRLTIKNITRNSARKLVCSYSSPYPSCDIRIIVPPLYKAGSCSVSISNWMVTGRCTLKRMFSSDNMYKCGWTQNDKKEEFGSLQITSKNYTERNSKSNINGVCLFTKTMPVDDGHYTYTMKVSLNTSAYFEKTLYIAKPYPVRLNHSCPSNVFEGSDVSCKCYSHTTGSPPAHIEWDGMDNATLLLKSVRREMNEEHFTCRMIWGPNGLINETSVFNLDVAYGPSGISIQSSTETSFEEPQTVLTCMAIDVYPSAEFHWNISCDNETYTVNTSTCMLPRARVQDDMTVACTANNRIFKNESLSGFVVLNIAENNGEGGINRGVVAAGAAAAAVIIAVIVSLIVVYHIKRRNINKAESPAVRFSVPSGDQFTISTITTSGHANNDNHVTSREVIEKKSCSAERSADHQARNTHRQVNERENKAKNTAQPHPSSTGNELFQDISATSCMNFTEVETNSGFCVYPIVTLAAAVGTKVCDTGATNTSVPLEDDYTVLWSQEARTEQEDYEATYNHLDFS